jgi:hypothetical protein
MAAGSISSSSLLSAGSSSAAVDADVDKRTYLSSGFNALNIFSDSGEARKTRKFYMDQMYLMSTEDMVMSAITYLINAIQTDDLVLNEDDESFNSKDMEFIKKKFWVPAEIQVIKDFLITGVAPFRVVPYRYPSSKDPDVDMDTVVPEMLTPRTWDIEWEYSEEARKMEMRVYDRLSREDKPIETFVTSRKWGPIANDYRFATPCGAVIQDYLLYKEKLKLANDVARKEAEPRVMIYRDTPAAGQASAVQYQRLDKLIGFLQGPDPRTGYPNKADGKALDFRQHGPFTILPHPYQVASRDFPERRLVFDPETERIAMAEKIAGAFGIRPSVLGVGSANGKGGDFSSKASDREIDHRVNDFTGYISGLANDVAYAISEMYRMIHKENVRAYATIRPKPDHALIERMVSKGVMDSVYARNLHLRMIGVDPKHHDMETKRSKELTRIRRRMRMQQRQQAGVFAAKKPKMNVDEEEEEEQGFKNQPKAEEDDDQEKNPQTKKKEKGDESLGEEGDKKKGKEKKKESSDEESAKKKKRSDESSDEESDKESGKKNDKKKKKKKKNESLQ